MAIIPPLKPASGGIRFGTRDFTEPSRFPSPLIPPFSGIYVMLVPDSRGTPRPFRVLYIGESDNLSRRVTRQHEKFEHWTREAAGSQLYFAFHNTMGMSDLQRRDAECELINHYGPPCNTKSISPFRPALRKI